jgi:plastocyanin
MKKMLLIAAVLLGNSLDAVGGSIIGSVASSKGDLPELQSIVVVWVEGLPAAPLPSKAPTISQSGVQFSPRVLTVVAGQTVTFPNEDDVAHNVFSMSSAKKFKLGIYPKGDTREVTFEKAGIIDLFCSIHRHMHAVIVVTPNEHFAETALGEKFSIRDIPAGEYDVKAWNAAYESVTVNVTVPAIGEANVPILFKD